MTGKLLFLERNIDKCFLERLQEELPKGWAVAKGNYFFYFYYKKSYVLALDFTYKSGYSSFHCSVPKSKRRKILTLLCLTVKKVVEDLEFEEKLKEASRKKHYKELFNDC